MNYSIVLDETFEKEVKRLAKRYPSLKQDLALLEKELCDNPETGVYLGKGLRKIRLNIRSKGKGKRGGARVITFTIVVAVEETEINLLYLYDKSERSSISSQEIEELLRKNGLE